MPEPLPDASHVAAPLASGGNVSFALEFEHLPPFLGLAEEDEEYRDFYQVDEKLAESPPVVRVSEGLDPKRARYIEFITTQMDLSREFAVANYDREVGPRVTAGLTQSVMDEIVNQSFATRPKGEDAIAYYTRVWSDLVGQKRLFVDDIEELDFDLLAGVENRINYLARTKGGKAADFCPPNYPPPRRPEPLLDARVEQRRAGDRVRTARYIAKLRHS